MRNLVLTLLALLAVPAFAAPIITATETDGVVTIGYDANGGDLVSGMGIIVTLSDGTIKAGSFQDLSTDYPIHPSTIVIDNGVVTDYNTPIADGGEGQATVTVEYGALYERGVDTPPATSGALFSFEIEGATGDVTVDAEATHAGGLVTEALEAFAPTAQVVVSGAAPVCMGNMDGDGDVDVTDLGLLTAVLSAHQKEEFPGSGALGIWKYEAVQGTDAGYNPVGDMDSDGDNDVTDLGLVTALLSANQKEEFPGSGALGIWKYEYTCP